MILLGRERAAFTGKAKFFFDDWIIGTEIVVGNWPVGADAFR